MGKKLTRKAFTPRSWRGKHQRLAGSTSPAFATAMRSLCCPGRTRLRVGWREWCLLPPEADKLLDMLIMARPRRRKL